MPKPTFTNLPPAKRDRIIDAALDEFAAHPLQSASVNRIVRAAGIAKGSFYQYFEGLEDLYRYLMFEHAAELKIAVMKAAGPPPAGGDLFDTLSYYAFHGLRFGLANPRIAAAARFIRSGVAHDALAPIARELTARSRVGIRHILSEGMRTGAIRGDVNLTAAVVFTDITLRVTMDEVFMDRFGVDLMALCASPETAAAYTDDDLKDAVRVVIDLLRRGLGTGSAAGAHLDLDQLRARFDPESAT